MSRPRTIPYGCCTEIDVVTGWVFKTYVECKKYDSKSVPLEDVAKFKEVLRMNGISSRRGLFVTNSKYSPRATEVGIRTIDGMQLDALRSRYLGKRTVWGRRLVGGSALCAGTYILATGLQQAGLAKSSKDWDKWMSGHNSRAWQQHTTGLVKQTVVQMRICAMHISSHVQGWLTKK